MQENPRYDDVVNEVGGYLKERMDILTAGGIASGAMAVDPGLGFGKTAEHNVKLIAHIKKLGEFGRPVVIGLSRKRFLAQITGRAVNERLAAGLGALAYCLLNGASVIRVHDVKESRDVFSVLKTILGERRGNADCRNIA